MRMPVMDGYEATRHIKAQVDAQAPAVIALRRYRKTPSYVNLTTEYF
jgi:CheY-like chemotaxis protein